jgi:hypothetical protein
MGLSFWISIPNGFISRFTTKICFYWIDDDFFHES